MKGSFSIEASLIVPVVLSIMLTALRMGTELCGETKNQVEELTKKELFDVVGTMYQLDQLAEIGDLFHGD